MLRLTKSSNKSVLKDACNDKDTAVTLAGPMQPDDDDYGYTSRESSAMYEKLLAKYNSVPEGEVFSKSIKKTAKDIDATKVSTIPFFLILPASVKYIFLPISKKTENLKE